MWRCAMQSFILHVLKWPWLDIEMSKWNSKNKIMPSKAAPFEAKSITFITPYRPSVLSSIYIKSGSWRKQEKIRARQSPLICSPHSFFHPQTRHSESRDFNIHIWQQTLLVPDPWLQAASLMKLKFLSNSSSKHRTVSSLGHPWQIARHTCMNGAWRESRSLLTSASSRWRMSTSLKTWRSSIERLNRSWEI